MNSILIVALAFIMTTISFDKEQITKNFQKATYVVHCKIASKPFVEAQDMRRLYTLNVTVIDDYKGKCPNREFLIHYHCDQPFTQDTLEQNMINSGEVILFLSEETSELKSTVTRTGEQYEQFEVVEIMHHSIYGEGRMIPLKKGIVEFLKSLK